MRKIWIQLVCGRARAVSVVSCEWWSVSYIRYFLTMLLKSAEEWALQWQGKVAHGCFPFVTWPSPLPRHTDKPALLRGLLPSEMLLSLFEGLSKPSAALLSPQWRIPCLLHLIPFSMIAGALQEGVSHWQSLGASLPWHPLRPSSGESCILYYSHAGVASSQLNFFPK